jgi:hypothetical protein
VLVLGAHVILKVYGGSYIAQTAVLFQLLALSLIPFCIETVAYSLDRVAGKPIRATLSQLAIAVLTLGGSELLFGRLGLNAVGVAVLGADLAVALVRLPTVLAAVRKRPAVIAPLTGAAQLAAMLGSHTQADSPRVADRRNGPPRVADRRKDLPPVTDRRNGAPRVTDRRKDSPPVTDRRNADAPPVTDRPNDSPPVTDRRNYAGRHRATGRDRPAPTGR